jgi:hypothetical protein
MRAASESRPFNIEREAVVGSGCGAGSEMLFHDEAL